MRILVCAVLTMVMLLAAPAAMADQNDAPVGLKILDLGLVRPISFVVSVASTAIFIGTVPLTYSMGVGYSLGTHMVAVPWRFTTSRYYGNFSEYRDGRICHLRGLYHPFAIERMIRWGQEFGHLRPKIAEHARRRRSAVRPTPE